MAPEPFPSYIEPTTFDANKMTADGPLGLENMRNLSLQERRALQQGDLKVDVLLGGKWVCSIPWRLFQAMSRMASHIDNSDPAKRQLFLPGGLSERPFLYVKDWLNDITSTSDFYLLKPRNIVAEDVPICRAARLLGMMEYAQHIFDHYWRFFQTVPSFEDLDLMQKMATTEEKVGMGDDGDAQNFLALMADRIAQMVCSNQVPNAEAWTAYLKGHPKVMKEVAENLDSLVKGGARSVCQQICNGANGGVTSPVQSTPVSAQPVSQIVGEQRRPLTDQDEKCRPRDSLSQLNPMAKSYNGIDHRRYSTQSSASVMEKFIATMPPRREEEAQTSTQVQTLTDDPWASKLSPPIYNPWARKLTQDSSAESGTPWANKRKQGQKEDHKDETVPLSSTASTPSLLEMAKKLFPQPADPRIADVWAAQQAQALLEQNMLYREECYQARLNPTFQFTNPNWKVCFLATQEPPRADPGVIGHHQSQVSRDFGGSSVWTRHTPSSSGSGIIGHRSSQGSGNLGGFGDGDGGARRSSFARMNMF
jgi:hypothetical protein